MVLAMPTEAQIDTFRIDKYAFEFSTPSGWSLHLKNNGFCEENEANIQIEKPFKCRDCSGAITLSFRLKAKQDTTRKDSAITDDVLKISSLSYAKEIRGYTVFYGHREANIDTDTFLYTNSKGDLILSKKKHSGQLKPVHSFTKWCFFPINDSIEMEILYEGLVPHEEESGITYAFNSFVDDFFDVNEKMLDSLIKDTYPYQEIFLSCPTDSIRMLHSYLKFPLLPGWTYSKISIKNSSGLILLHGQSGSRDSCNYRSFVLSSEKQKVGALEIRETLGKKTNEFLEGAYISDQYIDSVLLNEHVIAFENADKHHYFREETIVGTDTLCQMQKTDSITFHVYVDLTAEERIKMTLKYSYSSGTSETRNHYYREYYRFRKNFIEINDFEKIYRENKPED